MAIERQTMLDTVIHSDCLSVLRDMADNSVDAIVSDPPAGVGFMGREWDRYTRDKFIIFLRNIMIEALRVLKPGGHALIWALPRTSHWTATALEDAGFEVRDKLYHLFGSGFPKSLDISKAIDRMQGKEREVVGEYAYPDGKPRNTSQHKTQRNGIYSDIKTDGSLNDRSITAPATPEAAQYAGYGTALKPSCEEWILVRKPLAESSIAAQVLATGTGGLNIDACRVASGQDYQDTARENDHKFGGVSSFPNDTSKPGFTPHATGKRFPSHLLLSHSLWCVPRGIKRVRGDGHKTQNHVTRNVSHFGNGHTGTSAERYNDVEGMETVEAYDCAPDCPIAELDRQSGIRPSGYRTNVSCSHDSKNGMYGQYKDRVRGERGINDQGTASRYFTNFPPSPDEDYTPFLYQSKASRAERNKGCENLPETVAQRYGLTQELNSKQTAHKHTPQGNGHPTVKPLALMRWLIRLITPPDGIVLDPFCGSGSTCVAAIQEGKHFIGIEQDSSYCDIANARIEYARTHEPDVVQVATKKVKANGGGQANHPDDTTTRNAYGVYTHRSPVIHQDQEGMEEVEDWDCAPDCPVRILGEQSGVSFDRDGRNKSPNPTSFWGNGKGFENTIVRRGDTGTAARYFQQFPPDSLWCDEIDCSPIEEVP